MVGSKRKCVYSERWAAAVVGFSGRSTESSPGCRLGTPGFTRWRSCPVSRWDSEISLLVCEGNEVVLILLLVFLHGI